MSIGSGPPDPLVNCVRGVLFDNITFHHPLKGIYIKTNPGDTGAGIIDNITYSNLQIFDSLWYPIWIGPQQEKQPFQTGQGCNFFYPIDKSCRTDPLVPITNIHVYNVTAINGVFLPGVILCNETRPCTGFEFINVTNTGPFEVQSSYVCVNANGTAKDCNPAPPCFEVIS